MPRRTKRRETEIFSISFLDCITCGLGSVVLLLVLSDMRSPEAERSKEDLEAQVVKLQDELVDIAGQSEIINRDLKARQQQLSIEQAKIARLRGDLSEIRGQFAASKKEADVANEIEGQAVLCAAVADGRDEAHSRPGFPPQEGRCDRRHSRRQ